MNIAEKPLLSPFLFGRPGRAARVPVGTLLVLTAVVLSACTTSPTTGLGTRPPSSADAALVRFNSCGDALRNLRAAATNSLRASAFSVSGRSAGSRQAASGEPPAAGAASGPDLTV